MSDFLPISITTEAREAIHNTLNNSNVDTTYSLRVGVKGGGCGASFLLGFDKPTEHDQIYNIDNVKVIIDRRHLMYVVGNEIDFEQTAEGMGFTIGKKEK